MFLRWIIFAVSIHCIVAGHCRGHRTTEGTTLPPSNCCKPLNLTTMRIKITEPARIHGADNVTTSENAVPGIDGGDGACPTNAWITCTTSPYQQNQNSFLFLYAKEGETTGSQSPYPLFSVQSTGLGSNRIELVCDNGQWKAIYPTNPAEKYRFSQISCSQRVDFVIPGPDT